MAHHSIAVLVVNLHEPGMTQDVVGDLLDQDEPCDIVVFDQSKDFGVTDLTGCVIVHPASGPAPLCWVWNWFADKQPNNYLCFLNNDCRVPTRFMADNKWILDNEPNVGIVCHPVNVARTGPDILQYFVPRHKFVQGCDFTIRKSLWVRIPTDLLVWGGDDWVFHQAFRLGADVAVAASSPIIHYEGRSHAHALTGRKADADSWERHRQEWGFENLSHRAPRRP